MKDIIWFLIIVFILFPAIKAFFSGKKPNKKPQSQQNNSKLDKSKAHTNKDQTNKAHTNKDQTNKDQTNKKSDYESKWRDKYKQAHKEYLQTKHLQEKPDERSSPAVIRAGNKSTYSWGERGDKFNWGVMLFFGFLIIVLLISFNEFGS